MTRRSASVLASVLLLATLTPLWGQGPPRVLTPRPALGLERLAGPRLQELIGRQVTVEGFYYDGSVPMLVDDYNRVALNLPLPPDSYQLLVGRLPTTVRSGDLVQLRVQVRRPAPGDPPHTQDASAVLEPVITTAASRAVSPATTLPLRPLSRELLLRFRGPLVLRIRYAVLISGGINAANNHVRYWNETKATYNLLKDAGYTDANIYVLYADGVARDAGMTVDYAATKANITTVFNALAEKMGDNDTLFIMTTDHGGGFARLPIDATHPAGMYGGVVDTNGDEADAISEAAFNLDINSDGDKTDTLGIDETLWLWNGTTITDDEFRTELNKLTHYFRMVIVMEQCFSGGFIGDLLGPRRVIMTAANESQPSWARKDPTTNNYTYDMFMYHFLAALRGSTPDYGTSVNADTSGDLKVSMLEAYKYTRTNDTANEEPWYNDIGVLPPVNNPGVGNPQGVLGSAYFLPL